MIRKTLLALCAAAALAGCNPVAALNDSEAQIEQFHAGLGGDNAGALYAMAGSEFRATTTRAQFDELMTVVAAHLGPVQESERTSFNVNTNNGTTFTTIVMDTRFEKGEGVETFVFSGTGEDMRLAGWHVNSPQLVLTAQDVADESGGNAKELPPVVTVDVNELDPATK